MFLTYILWFLGVIFGIITVVEIAVIIYRLLNKKNNVKANIIIAVITTILCIGFSSSAAISLFDKIINKNDRSLSEIGKEFGKASADITANAYQEFVETWDETVRDKDSQ